MSLSIKVTTSYLHSTHLQKKINLSIHIYAMKKKKFLEDHGKMWALGTTFLLSCIFSFYAVFLTNAFKTNNFIPILFVNLGHAKFMMDALNIPYAKFEDQLTQYMANVMIWKTTPRSLAPYQMAHFFNRFWHHKCVDPVGLNFWPNQMIIIGKHGGHNWATFPCNKIYEPSKLQHKWFFLL
jgi:hypothetical protein